MDMFQIKLEKLINDYDFDKVCDVLWWDKYYFYNGNWDKDEVIDLTLKQVRKIGIKIQL